MKTAGEILQFALLSLMAGLIIKAIFNFSLSIFLIAIAAFFAYLITNTFFKKKYNSLSGSTLTLVIGVIIGIAISVSI